MDRKGSLGGISDMVENIVTDIIGGIILAVLLVMGTLIILYCYVLSKFKKENKTVTIQDFITSFFEKNIVEKLEMNIFDNEVNEGEKVNSPIGKKVLNNTDPKRIETIYSVDESQAIGSKILKRQSKNYGKDDTFSIRTWYGINYKRLLDEDYKYICFIVKEENEKVYLKVEDIKNIINNDIMPEEREKYIKRNSFDTYLMKSLKDEKWYITRMGVHFENPIKIS